jgi:hypothetical protein
MQLLPSAGEYAFELVAARNQQLAVPERLSAAVAAAAAFGSAALFQTIIECLKQACTGEMPPNIGGNGRNWVMDPKVRLAGK